MSGQRVKCWQKKLKIKSRLEVLIQGNHLLYLSLVSVAGPSCKRAGSEVIFWKDGVSKFKLYERRGKQ